MSRSGYDNDYEGTYPGEFWEQAVKNAIRGKRGQKFLRDLLDALDAMPEKALIANRLRDEDGSVCALGAVCVRRGIDTKPLEPIDEHDMEHWDPLATALKIAPALVREVEYRNDDGWIDMTPEARYQDVYRWVQSQIRPAAPEGSA
jgi:hypothetical protein